MNRIVLASVPAVNSPFRIYVTLSGKVRILASNAQTQWLVSPLPSHDGKYLAFQAQSWDNNAAILPLKY